MLLLLLRTALVPVAVAPQECVVRLLGQCPTHSIVHERAPPSTVRTPHPMQDCLRHIRHTKLLLDTSAGELLPSAQAFQRQQQCTLHPKPHLMDAWRRELPVPPLQAGRLQPVGDKQEGRQGRAPGPPLRSAAAAAGGAAAAISRATSR
jgi:hypothetical protein